MYHRNLNTPYRSDKKDIADVLEYWHQGHETDEKHEEQRYSDLGKGNSEGMEKTLMKTDRRWREPETAAKMEIRRHSCNYSFDPPTT